MRRKWWYALVLGAGLVCLVALWIGYRRLTEPERLRAFAGQYLQSIFRGRVSVGGASFGWWDQVRLHDVRLAAVDEQEGARPVAIPQGDVFYCRQLELALGIRALLRGKVEIDSVVAFAPEWTIRRNMDSGLTNLHDLVLPEPLRAAGNEGPLPRLELRDARLRVVRAEGGVERTVEDLRLTLRGRPSDTGPRWYDMVWTRDGVEGASGHSQIDLTDFHLRNVRGGLPWMPIEAVAIALDTPYRSAAKWSDLLGLEGAVRVSDYDFAPAGGAIGGGSSATLELHDATLALPVSDAEAPLPPTERFLRFEKVRGRVELRADEVRAEFDGRIQNSACRAVVTMRAADGQFQSINDVHWDARFEARGMMLPRVSDDAPMGERRFVEHWEDLKRFYRRFDPHGPVDLEFEVARQAGADEPLELRFWTIRALGGDASFINFPYRLYNARGLIVGTSGGIWIDSLRGERDGAEVEVNGWYSDATPCAQADVRVKARHVPIDDGLCQGASPRFRTILARFQPEGEIGLDIILQRPPCTEFEPMPWDQTVAITPGGIRARYVGFPYPVQDLRGTLIVGEGGMQLPLVTGRCGGGELRVGGQSVFSPDGGSDTELTVEAVDVPVDEQLLAALPDGVLRQVSAFHPEGVVDTVLKVRQRDDAAAELQATVDLRDGRLRHEALPIPLANVTARFELMGSTLRIESLRGASGSAQVLASGIVEDLSTGRPSVRVRAQTDGWVVDDDLYRQAPPSWLAELAGWRVFGPVDAGVEVSYTAGDAEPTQWQVEAVLRDATVRHPNLPLPVTSVRGDMRLHAGVWESPELEGRYGDGQIRVGLFARKSAEVDEGHIRFDAKDLTLDPSLHALLPASARSAWGRAALYGRVDVSLPRLDYARDPADGQRLWSVAGEVLFHDVGTAEAIGVDEVVGVLEGEGALVDRRGGTALQGTLRLEKARVRRRELTDVVSEWSFARTAEGVGRIALEQLEGGFYAGSASGEGELRFDADKATYRADMLARDVDVDRFFNAGWSASSGREPVRIGGTLDARLRMAGTLGDAATRSGGGRVEITHGGIYRLPLLLAIFNVIDLSPPDGEMFADAAADLYIMGNRIDLHNIELRGPLMSLFGGGSLSWPDLGLDITLVNVHNRRWTRVPGLTAIMERTSRELVEMHVTGSADKPAVRARPIPALSGEFRELFQKKKPKRIESAPS